MLDILIARLQQGHKTIAYPRGEPPALPPHFRGLPILDVSKCPQGCQACADSCPTQAIDLRQAPILDLGRCLFCAECQESCPEKAITYQADYKMAVRRREDLRLAAGGKLSLAHELQGKIKKLFGRSLKLRVVSAGGCNACEADVNVLTTIGWDLGRFGVDFVASPRHADGLIITGAVSENMKLALKKTYEAVPDPKIVIAVGACAISGGPYINHPEVLNGASAVVPVDLFIPGCPPHPLTILDGLLRLLGKLKSAHPTAV